VGAFVPVAMAQKLSLVTGRVTLPRKLSPVYPSLIPASDTNAGKQKLVQREVYFEWSRRTTGARRERSDERAAQVVSGPTYLTYGRQCQASP
jgi:hypothetical protein